ncbi:MAG: PIN domain-containing protein [Candidatus ainarchaeum sp.]|nr:PIN domain-containing protein [Candidatus ainarchaeum sp.]
MTDSKLFLDSSVWLGYFLGNLPEAKNIVDSQENILLTSIISIHEICKRLKTLGKTEKETGSAIRFIEDNSIIVNLNKEIAINAVNCCAKYKLHTIDSLIYSSARAMETIFVTADSDFKETPKTKIIAAPNRGSA